MKFPWLVQRLFLRSETNESMNGIDQWFDFDYMGATEFEFGTLPDALRKMRNANDSYLKEPKRIKLDSGEAIWFFGRQHDLEIASKFFQDQIKPWQDRQIRLKELSYIGEAYSDPDHNWGKPDLCCWWALDLEFPWLLFKKKKSANKWIQNLPVRNVQMGNDDCS